MTKVLIIKTGICSREHSEIEDKNYKEINYIYTHRDKLEEFYGDIAMKERHSIFEFT